MNVNKKIAIKCNGWMSKISPKAIKQRRRWSNTSFVRNIFRKKRKGDYYKIIRRVYKSDIIWEIK